VIKVENISKRFQLGTIGSGSLRRDLHGWWERSVLKKKSDFDDAKNGSQFNGKREFWALKDINFEVNEGEALGIIGRNGAGKTTMLKILSRIVKPTKGRIIGRGKVSSLLEIGTGFHPELTGRENIFISGHLLGMTRSEILKKLDEIISFSGIESFLDTPVKRYSSGMYVRLAFSVAAHLEPDILLIDEVLAVGDAEFQKKCLVKMNDTTSNTGRTIIFVSHNLQAVTNLCPRCLWFDEGVIRLEGDSRSVVAKYLSRLQEKVWKQDYNTWEIAPGNEYIRMVSVELIPHLDDPEAPIDIRTPLTIRFRFRNCQPKVNLSVDLLLFTISGECIFDIQSKAVVLNNEIVEGECTIPGNFLNDGSYYFSLYFVKDTSSELYAYNECLMFEVADFRENNNWYDKWWGFVRPNFPLTMKRNSDILLNLKQTELF